MIISISKIIIDNPKKLTLHRNRINALSVTYITIKNVRKRNIFNLK